MDAVESVCFPRENQLVGAQHIRTYMLLPEGGERERREQQEEKKEEGRGTGLHFFFAPLRPLLSPLLAFVLFSLLLHFVYSS